MPSATVTLEEYDRAGGANLKQQFPDCRPLGLTTVIVDGRTAYKRVHTGTIAGRLLQLQQVFVIERDVAYVISSGAPLENVAGNATTLDQVAGAFTIGRW